MKRTLTALFFIQTWWWLLSSCHKESTGPVIMPVQQHPPVKEIVNNYLQWSINYETKIVSATLTWVDAPPSPNSADSILAVYILGDPDVAIRRGDPRNYVDFYYQIERRAIVLHKNYFKIDVATSIEILGLGLQGGKLPKRAKVVFR
jgi:hypothetical protein